MKRRAGTALRWALGPALRVGAMEEGVLEVGETAGRNGVEMGAGSGSEGGGVGTSATSGGTNTETGRVHSIPSCHR